MNGDDKKFLGDRLIKLETLFIERWNNHDKRSEEMWRELNHKVNIVVEKVQKLPCEVHIEKFDNVLSHISRLWGLVILVISGCVGGFWWMLKIK